MSTSRWKLDRPKLKKAKDGFARLVNGMKDYRLRKVLVCPPPNRNYRDWSKWLGKRGLEPCRHRPWGEEAVEERRGYYFEPWSWCEGAVYIRTRRKKK